MPLLHVKSRRVSERGSVLIEMAFAFPVLLLFMLTIIDFGVNWGNKVEMHDSARAAARNASVGRYGTNTGCFTNFTSGASPQATKFTCKTKSSTSMDDNDVAVKLFYIGPTGKLTNDFSATARTANKYAVVVCVSVRAYSVTGVMNSVFSGRFQHSRKVTKTGKISNDNFVMPFEEAPLSTSGVSDNWGWCQADDPNGTE